MGNRQGVSLFSTPDRAESVHFQRPVNYTAAVARVALAYSECLDTTICAQYFISAILGQPEYLEPLAEGKGGLQVLGHKSQNPLVGSPEPVSMRFPVTVKS